MCVLCQHKQRKKDKRKTPKMENEKTLKTSKPISESEKFTKNMKTREKYRIQIMRESKEKSERKQKKCYSE